MHSAGLGESLRISALSCFHGLYTGRLWGSSAAASSYSQPRPLNSREDPQIQSPEHTVLVTLKGKNLLCSVKTVCCLLSDLLVTTDLFTQGRPGDCVCGIQLWEVESMICLNQWFKFIRSMSGTHVSVPSLVKAASEIHTAPCAGSLSNATMLGP